MLLTTRAYRFSSVGRQLAAAVVLSWWLVSSVAATEAYIRIEANGSVITEGEGADVGGQALPDFTPLAGYSLGLDLPSRESGGTRAGNFSVRPVTVIKSLSRSSVLLKQAIAQGQTISAELRVFRTDPNVGELIHIYTIEIVNGLLTRVAPFFDAGAEGSGYFETVSIEPNGLIVTHEPSGATTQIQASATP